MKKLQSKAAAIAFLVTAGLGLQAQRPTEVVNWSVDVTKYSSNSATVELSATIRDGWHVYALSQPAGGPTPLKISIPTGSHYVLLMPIAEGKVTRHDDPGFKMETLYYLNHASFNLSVRGEAAAASATNLPVDVRFQACNDRLCLPPYTAHLTAELKKK